MIDDQPGPILVVANAVGTEDVAIKLAGGEVLSMTSKDARRLAVSLITEVNRAEVKTRQSPEAWLPEDFVVQPP